MAKKGFGLLSGKIKHPITGNFIGLKDVEEFLGVPTVDNSIIVTHTDGSRNFYELGGGLSLDGVNDKVFVDETSIAIDTTGFNYSGASTLDQVLADLDANVNTAIGSSLNSITTDSTITGAGTSASPLSIGQSVTTTSNVTFNTLDISSVDGIDFTSNQGASISFGQGHTPASFSATPGSGGHARLYLNNSAANNQLFYGNTTGLLIGNGENPAETLDVRGNTVVNGSLNVNTTSANDGITVKASNEAHIYLNTSDEKYQAVLFNSYGNIGLRPFINDATLLNQGGNSWIFYHNNGYPNANNAYTKFDVNGSEILKLTTSGATITGDLTITGTTTTINTEEINLADNTILLNSNLDAGTAPSENAGIEINRGSSTNVSLLWDESQDRWTIGSQAIEVGSVDINGYGQVINSSGEWVGVPAGVSSINGLNDGFSDGSSVALGCNAMADELNISANSRNTALGVCAQRSITTGQCNVAIGSQALEFNTTANSNVAIGTNALRCGVGGFGNVAVGNSSQINNCTGNYNTSLGTGALGNGLSSPGNDNVALGYCAAPDSGLVNRATVIGSCAAQNASGNYPDSVYIGYTAGKCARLADTVVIGSCALSVNNIGGTAGAVYIGTRAALNLSSGGTNAIVGHESLKTATSANRNVALGSWTLENLVSGADNVAVGHCALNKSLVSGNVAVGSCTLRDNTTGVNNLAIGNRSLQKNVTGTNNLAVGSNALCNAWGSSVNTVVGHNAMVNLGAVGETANCCDFNTPGSYNVAFGNSALNNLGCGDLNTVIGFSAGSNIQCGSNNILIGQQAAGVGTFGDQIDNQIVIGNANNNRLVIPGVDLDTNDAQDGELLQWSSTNGGFIWVEQSNTLSVSTSETPPTSPTNGSVWYDTSDGTLSVYYGDGTSAQWVTTSGPQGCIGYTGSQGTTGYTGSQGAIGYTGSTGISYICDLLDAKSDTSRCSYGIGTGALATQTNGGSLNIAVGYNAGCKVNSTSNAQNVYLGAYAGAEHVTGGSNVVLGGFAGGLNGTMTHLVAIGANAAYGNNNSCDSVVIGTCASYGISQTTRKSVVIGSCAGKSLCDSIAIGAQTLCSHTDTSLGRSNVAIGRCALIYDISGARNVAVGEKSLGGQTCGLDNIAIGNCSLLCGVTALQNVAIGSYTLQLGGNPQCNTWLGNNIAIGHGAGQFLGSTDMTACPSDELMSDNIFIGAQSGQYTMCAKENTFIGGSAGVGLYDGLGNIGIGYRAFANIGHCGDNNIVIGRCVCVGGFNAVVSNKIVIGNGFNDKLTVGSGGINFEADATGITIAGTTEVKNYVSTTTATTQFAIAEFAIADYVGGKFIIQATDNTTSDRHITEVLMTHNGTTAVATEYGIVTTNTSLFTVDVDISASNARVLITPASTNSTKFTISGNMILT